MFYHTQLDRTIDLAPRHFGPKLRETLEQKLIQEVEGTCNGKYGFVIAVTEVLSVSEGKIRQDGTGMATFNVSYTCIVFRPFKTEVLDCVVSSVNKMGFFCEAGPVNIFVSNHLIPEGFSYASTGDPCYVSNDQSERIQEGTEVRLRLVGLKIDATEIFCIGTIKDDYLGVINNPTD